MDQRDGRIRHDRREISEQFVAKIGTSLGKITKQAHQKKEQRKQSEQEIVRELGGATEYVVIA